VLVYIGEMIVIGLLTYSMRETLKSAKASTVEVKAQFTDHLPSDADEKSSLFNSSTVGGNGRNEEDARETLKDG
jgi:hypothetical protein